MPWLKLTCLFGLLGVAGCEPVHESRLGSDLAAGFEERTICLEQMQAQYDSWLRDLERKPIGSMRELAAELTKKLPRSYVENLQRLRDLPQRNNLENNAAFSAYTRSLTDAFELSAGAKYPNCASASYSWFGQRVDWNLIRSNPALLGEFVEIGADDSYYRGEVIPVIVDFQMNAGRLDTAALKSYVQRIREINESVLPKTKSG